MHDTRSDAVQLVTLEVQHHLPEWFGADARLSPVAPEIRKHKRSYFVRFAVSQDTQDTGVLIKIPRPEPANSLEEALRLQLPRSSTRREFDILVACSELFPRADSSHLCAVRPLSYWPAWNAIAMEELKCRPLGDYRLRLPFKWGDIPAPFPVLLNRAGQWLSVFHQEMGDSRIETLTRLQLFSELNRNLEQLSELTGRRYVAPIYREINDRINRFRERPIPTVRLHGDFKLGNILVSSDGKLAAVDTKMRNRGPIHVDLAKLLSDLHTDHFSALTFGLLARSEEWQKAFLDGYFDSSAGHDPEVLKLYQAMAVLEKWTWDEKLLASRGRRFHAVRLALRQYFPRLLRRILVAWMSTAGFWPALLFPELS